MPGAARPEEDRHLTVRVPRALVALIAALLVHASIAALSVLFPMPKPVEERVELTVRSAPPPPPVAAASPEQKKPVRRARADRAPPPPTSPVLPELPPSQEPKGVILPVAEKLTDPAPAPLPRWQALLSEALAASPPLREPTGELAPSFSVLERVALADPRMHDEENERRLMEDHGAFFRRGLEALRGNWHPEQVLRVTERDPSRRCGRQTRTTFAVAVLDKKGNVVDVDLKNPSGCDELDAEAVTAFRRVAHFPNPPAGIFIGPDGTPLETARYPVRFIVTFDGGLQLDWRG